MEGVQFTVNKDEHGISGFTLMGVGKTEAGMYCLSFLTAQAKGKGRVSFENGRIVFTHGGVSMKEANPEYDIYGMSEGGVFSPEISGEDAEEIAQLLSQKGKYATAQIRVRPEFAWGKGFTLYIKRD